MNEAGLTAFADPELSELLEGEPELLAIADAITATTPKRADESAVRAPRRRRLPRLAARRARSLVAAAVLVAVLAAAPALAFSSTVRELVGLKSTAPPDLVATLTGPIIYKHKLYPYGLGSVTVNFTIGERGKPPGTGIPRGSAFYVLFVPKTGSSTGLTTADGTNGRYSATTHVGTSGIASIEIGGFPNIRTGIPFVDGGFWIPITNNPYSRHG